MTWTAARGGEVCGGCQLTFSAAQPIALLTALRKPRCEFCVAPAPVDWDAVHAVIEERLAQRTGEPVVPVSRGGFTSLAGATVGLHHTLKHHGGIKGRKRASSLKPYSAVANDPAVRRAGEAR